MPEKMKVLVVDDEAPARHNLKDLLKRFSTVDIVGEADSVGTAIAAIHSLKPDVIFLDIQFPGESGFDLFDKIDITAEVVFVTAYDEYAVRAFKVNACDYLLKPVNPERLTLTMNRLQVDNGSPRQAACKFSYDDKIFLKFNLKYYFLGINTIVKITSAEKYTEIITSGKQKGLVRKTLTDWEECLPETKFLRINRSVIINVDFVERVEKYNHSAYRVYLIGMNDPPPISRRNASKIRKKLNQWQH
jgi:two-component system, LytTR family, response regulator